MQISNVNNAVNSQRVGFKSAMPVFVQVCTDAKNIAPVVGEELNNTFMLKVVHMLNNSLKRGISSERDHFAERLRNYFRRWVKDFGSRVTAFTCVDGGFNNGEMKPYFYLLTGETSKFLDGLRQSHKNAVKQSQGYKTANLKIAKDNYYNKGKNIVLGAFSKFRPFGKEPKALFTYFKPIRKKNGEITDYVLYNAEFKDVKDINNPSITLEKQV